MSKDILNQELISLIENEKNESLNPELFRRNIVISGVNVQELIGQTFEIGGVTFKGAKHCAPCKWMNLVFGEGTMGLMRGRGGLRAQVIKGGFLDKEKTILSCKDSLDWEMTQAIYKPKLP